MTAATARLMQCNHLLDGGASSFQLLLASSETLGVPELHRHICMITEMASDRGAFSCHHQLFCCQQLKSATLLLANPYWQAAHLSD